jgi:sarcosine oxidase subunit gamma
LSIPKENAFVHDLSPITPLGGSAPRIDDVAGTSLTEVTDLALASVAARQGKEENCARALKTMLEADAPEPGRAHLGQPLSAVWMGPDQWMIGAPFETHEDIESRLKAKLKSSASVTEQTDAWACFDLSGSGVRAVMELICNVNMSTLQSGDALRSSIHHLGCFVICGDPDSFVRILGPRASAGSLHHAIYTAMKSAL